MTSGPSTIAACDTVGSETDVNVNVNAPNARAPSDKIDFRILFSLLCFRYSTKLQMVTVITDRPVGQKFWHAGLSDRLPP